jgi:hypothetical protein
MWWRRGRDIYGRLPGVGGPKVRLTIRGQSATVTLEGDRAVIQNIREVFVRAAGFRMSDWDQSETHFTFFVDRSAFRNTPDSPMDALQDVVILRPAAKSEAEWQRRIRSAKPLPRPAKIKGPWERLPEGRRTATVEIGHVSLSLEVRKAPGVMVLLVRSDSFEQSDTLVSIVGHGLKSLIADGRGEIFRWDGSIAVRRFVHKDKPMMSPRGMMQKFSEASGARLVSG